MNADTVYYFGYGSLVNRLTRSPSEKFYKATLQGWERQWAHRADIPEFATGYPERIGCLGICPLTIARRPGCRIDGVLAELNRDQLPSLDRRERGYDRLALPASDFDIEGEINGSEIYVYRSSDVRYGWADDQYPLAQSYVDVVVSGYRSLFDDDGVARLLASTRGWDLPTLNDRSNPAYGRALQLDTTELALIDEYLGQVRDNNNR